MKQTFLRRCAVGVLAAGMLLTAGCGEKPESQKGFTPKLDTNASVSMDITGYFGNFEALDQVTNDFNQYYPNVTFSYQQVGGDSVASFLDANPGTDLFMVSMQNVDALVERCVDLNTEVDFADVDSDMLKLYNRQGIQTAIPMGQNLFGMIVNETLLEKEGLSIPKNQVEFMNVLSALKNKGYTPIQGPTSKIYAELTRNMAFATLCSDEKLLDSAKAGSQEAVDALMPAFEFLDTIVEEGYTDLDINASYPDDNYDGAILRFFEGDVPFWVCNTEKVSGMKKRESKSETFQNAPFDYTYIYPPIGEDGSYVFQEPWFGFAANKEGPNSDYAIEFLRFLATKDELNKMADTKGIPSVAKESTNPAVYKNILASDMTNQRTVNEGTINSSIESSWYRCTTNYVNGGYDSAQSAIADFLSSIA